MMAHHLTAEQRSPGAYGLYRAFVARGQDAPTPMHAKYGLEALEREWESTLADDAVLFGIDLRLAHGLSWAHARYADMIGKVRGPFALYRAEERAAYRHLFAGEAVYFLDHATAFMAEACELPWAQANLWVCRYRIKVANSGLLTSDPAPWWAFASDGDGLPREH